MRVLVIDEWFPWPLESGKKIRSFNLISRMAMNHEIHYLAYARLPVEKDKIEAIEKRGMHVVTVEDKRIPKWTRRFYFSVLKNLFSEEPFSTMYHITPALISSLTKAVAAIKPDLVHCEWTNLAPVLTHVEGIPKIIAAHNVESDIWKRLADNTLNPLKKLVGRQQARRIEHLEISWYPKVDACIAVSNLDKEVIEGYGAKVFVVENGVDLSYYEHHQGAVDRNSLVFVASMDTFANQDAVEYFLKEIFPIIKEKEPEAVFWVVGKDPPQRIVSYSKSDPSVRVTGCVPDVREYISRAAVSVVPLRIGGGSRLKILEALAMKKAVVSTPVGAEGLELQDGKDIVLSASSREFAERVLRLMSDRKKRENLGLAGYEVVQARYDWDMLARKQEVIWQKVLGKN